MSIPTCEKSPAVMSRRRIFGPGRARFSPRWRSKSSKASNSQAKLKKNVRSAIERVAARLGNTPTICRKCYIHPEILNSYAEGALLLQAKDQLEAELRDDLGALSPEEAAVLSLLQGRLNRNPNSTLKT